MAEMKLFNMKLWIVPIPWSHDQYDNAKYYVEKHDDVMINQKINFERTLNKCLIDSIGFKKEVKEVDFEGEIEVVKNMIWKTVV